LIEQANRQTGGVNSPPLYYSSAAPLFRRGDIAGKTVAKTVEAKVVASLSACNRILCASGERFYKNTAKAAEKV